MVLLQDQERPLHIKEMMSRRKRILTIMTASVTAVIILYYFIFIRIVEIPTSSMANTVIPGDRLIVTKLFGNIKRGDVIVFKFPHDTSIQYLSRVIGLPGESIEIKGSRVYINGEELRETRVFVKEEMETFPMHEISYEGDGSYRTFYYSRKEGLSHMFADAVSAAGKFGVGRPHKIAEGNYFVMGDNRDNSDDSRFWGTVSEGFVTGKALRILFNRQSESTSNDIILWDRFFAKP